MWIKVNDNLYNLNNILQIIKDENEKTLYFWKDNPYFWKGFNIVFINMEELNKVLETITNFIFSGLKLLDLSKEFGEQE